MNLTSSRVGNHCLYNLPRRKLLPLLKIQSCEGYAYFDFSPVPEYRFVVLDGYDISAIGWPQDHPRTMEALKFLREKNPNVDKNSPAGLMGLERRFLMFNGAVGKEQMEWLNGVLQEATELKQKVVVCCHLPLDPGTSTQEALLWNYDEVMELIHRYNCVKVCIAGHDHKGGYSIDSHGVHHKVLEAALECPPGTDAFGYIKVYDDSMSLVGTGKMECRYVFYSPSRFIMIGTHYILLDDTEGKEILPYKSNFEGHLYFFKLSTTCMLMNGETAAFCPIFLPLN